MKCHHCGKSDEVVTRPDGPYCLDCGRAVLGPSDAAAGSADGEAALGEAMQDLWNDRCVDCGEIPTCFEVHGPRTTRITADFEGSAFVRDIVATLKSRGYSILPNAEVRHGAKDADLA